MARFISSIGQGQEKNSGILAERNLNSFFAATQEIALNGLVEDLGRKEKFNLALPIVLMEAFNRVAERYGRGGRWMGFTAAMTAFLRLSDDERQRLIEEVGMAELRGDFRPLANGQSIDFKPPPTPPTRKRS